MAVVACLAFGAPAAIGVPSIFDDDWKPPARTNPPADPVPAAEPVPPAPSRIKLPPPTPERAKPEPAKPEPTNPGPVTPVPAKPAVPVARAPIPSAPAIAKAEAMVHNVFKTEYSLKATADQYALAHLLLNESDQNQGDDAVLYVLLRDARELAVAVGDVDGAVAAARGLRNTFLDPAWPTSERETLRGALRNLSVPSPLPVLGARDAIRRAVELGLLQAERDAAAGDYNSAVTVMSEVSPLSRRVTDPDLVYRTTARLTTLKAIAAEAELVRPSIEAVRVNPNNADAATAVGRFYAFVTDQPRLGLPWLARGSDQKLKAAALKELAATKAGDPPIADQLGIGDGWAEAAKTVPLAGPLKDGIQRRALMWYDRAGAQDAPLMSASARKRAGDLRVLRLLPGGLVGQYYCGSNFALKKFARLDPRVEYVWNGIAVEASLGKEYFSIRWSGFIKTAPGKYQLVAAHDDGMRVWLDGKLVINHWDDVGRETVDVTSNGAPQELKVEYTQGSGGAYAGLGWTPAGAKKPKEIPPTMLFHEPIGVEPVLAAPPAPDDKGAISLTAAAARIFTTGSLHLGQTESGEGQIVSWSDDLGWLRWDVEVKTPGLYNLELVYSSLDHDAGGTYSLALGGKQFQGTVADTGGWSTHHLATAKLGTVYLAPGGQVAYLRPTSKRKGLALMNVTAVNLTPVR